LKIERIAIDLDGVVLDSISRICDLYNTDYQYYTGFTPIKPEDIHTWDFDELNCATRELIDAYFCTPRFFEGVKMMSCSKWIIDKLSDEYEINFVSSGKMPNLRLKEIWKKKYYPYARLIGVDIDNHEDKAHIKMGDCVFIDDVSRNLRTSNAPIKICYGKVYPWNEDWDGIRCETWSETFGTIRKVVKEYNANQI